MSDLTERAPLLCEAITEAFGERCEDFEPDCWCCRAWAELDDLTAAPAEARDKALEEAAKQVDYSVIANKEPTTDYIRGRYDISRAIAARLRALKEKP